MSFNGFRVAGRFLDVNFTGWFRSRGDERRRDLLRASLFGGGGARRIHSVTTTPRFSTSGALGDMIIVTFWCLNWSQVWG